jgi:hypothetical protein
MKTVAMFIVLITGCTHTAASVCPAVYDPHLCVATVTNTEERASFAAYGSNKCIAMSKLHTTLEATGVSPKSTQISCGRVLE